MTQPKFAWSKKRVLVTGGAGFIGSHLVDRLITLGSFVRVVDNLSSGKLANLQPNLEKTHLEFIKADLREPNIPQQTTKNIDTVIHLAGDHGGRGYIDTHQAGPASNFFLDGLVFSAALKARVEKVVYASSGCVYPKYLQQNHHQKLFLTEAQVGPPYDADNTYGYAKLMGELVLKTYHQEYGLPAVSCRLFTVYGPRAKENHAILGLIAKAFIRQNPFEVWGNGEQIRNWTYVDDIVTGLMLAAEKIDDGTAINLGTRERIKVLDAALEVLRYTGHQAKIKLLPHMPTGPVNRVASNLLAKKLLGWQPQVKFVPGLHKTIDWYFSTHNLTQVKKNLAHLLVSR
ncbi:MAG: NAD-dependent epimerase/dehydratase family protein [Candidatus Chisholmbacteria bacterium]|nr:NAD-dependent epimerase/dehydratase family protein [Candidatus Chisholmbacteria bacterium]